MVSDLAGVFRENRHAGTLQSTRIYATSQPKSEMHSNIIHEIPRSITNCSQLMINNNPFLSCSDVIRDRRSIKLPCCSFPIFRRLPIEPTFDLESSIFVD